jgi:hypothetical protein
VVAPLHVVANSNSTTGSDSTATVNVPHASPCTCSGVDGGHHSPNMKALPHALWCRQLVERVLSTPRQASGPPSHLPPQRRLWIVHGANDDVCPPFAAEALASIACAVCTSPAGAAKKQNKGGRKGDTAPGPKGKGEAAARGRSSSSWAVTMRLVADASHDTHDGGEMEDAFLRYAEEMSDDVVERWL